jgi:hypothetical protein
MRKDNLIMIITVVTHIIQVKGIYDNIISLTAIEVGFSLMTQLLLWHCFIIPIFVFIFPCYLTKF